MRKVNITIKHNKSIRLRMREVGVAEDGTHNAINSVTVGIMEQTDERKMSMELNNKCRETGCKFWSHA